MRTSFKLLPILLLVLASVALASDFNATDADVSEACTLGGLGGCSTSNAAGIRKQVAAELNKMGYKFVGVNSQWIKCSGCQMQGVAHDALVKAAKSKNDYITLNSAWRASTDQYLLYKWYQARQCGIQLAARPGTSNHEGGLAIDTSNYNYWRSTLEKHGWRWLGSKDRVHFDYIKGGSDLRKKNVQAFQRLWNRHNPKNRIGEDGIYGPATQSAMARSPCNGW